MNSIDYTELLNYKASHNHIKTYFKEVEDRKDRLNHLKALYRYKPLFEYGDNDKLEIIMSDPDGMWGEMEQLYREYLFMHSTIDLSCFIEYVVTDEKKVNPVTRLPVFVRLEEFHREWCEALEAMSSDIQSPRYLSKDTAEKLFKHKKLNVFCPSETGKTWIFSIAHTLSEIGRNPNNIIGIISNSSEQAKKSLFSISQYIEFSEEYKRVFPHVKPMSSKKGTNKTSGWTKSDIRVERTSRAAKDPTVSSRGIGSRDVTGARYDWVKLDDILRYDPNLSENELRKGIDWYNNTIQQRAKHLVSVNTAWSNSDIAHYLEKQHDVVTLKYSFEKEDELDGITYISWPEKHPREKLDIEKKRDLVSYNRNRRSRTSTIEEQVFGAYIDKVLINDWNIQQANEWDKFIGMDLATVRRKGTAICVIAVSPEGKKKVVIDVKLGKWDAREKRSYIRDFCEMYDPICFKVETNSQQLDVFELFGENNEDLPIESIETKATKEGILNSMALEMQRGLWRFNLSDAALDYLEVGNYTTGSEDDWTVFMSQVRNYSHDAKGENDMIMAWMFASEGSKQYSGHDTLCSVIDIDEDEKILTDDTKSKYTFNDYDIYNSISRKYGFEPKQEYYHISNFIKHNPDKEYDESLVWSKEEFERVKEDMQRYVKIMNGAS